MDRTMTKMIDDIENYISGAVSHYWQTRKAQREKQKKRGVSDAGLRSAVTGGAQMDGFIRLFTEIIVDAGMEERYVFKKKLLHWLQQSRQNLKLARPLGTISIIERKKQWVMFPYS